MNLDDPAWRKELEGSAKGRKALKALAPILACMPCHAWPWCCHEFTAKLEIDP